MDITQLKEDGLMILPQVLNGESLDSLKAEFDKVVQDRSKLKIHDDRWSWINQPFVNCRHTIPLAFGDLITGLATQYFKEMIDVDNPGIGTCNLRRSYVYKRKQAPDTTMFHCDTNRPDLHLLKFFIYLNDVDMEGGPFVYVKGTHIDKPANAAKPYRKSDTEIESAYGDKITYVTANYGDLVMAVTTGFHKGLKNKSKNRDMFTINYVDAPENNKFDISKENLAQLSDDKKSYARFLNVR